MLLALSGGILAFLRIWATLASVDAFQLSLFSFVYFPLVQLSPFFPRILKLTQIWE